MAWDWKSNKALKVLVLEFTFQGFTKGHLQWKTQQKSHTVHCKRNYKFCLFIPVLKWPDPNLTEVNEETLNWVTMGFGLYIY